MLAEHLNDLLAQENIQKMIAHAINHIPLDIAVKLADIIHFVYHMLCVGSILVFGHFFYWPIHIRQLLLYLTVIQALSTAFQFLSLELSQKLNHEKSYLD